MRSQCRVLYAFLFEVGYVLDSSICAATAAAIGAGAPPCLHAAAMPPAAHQEDGESASVQVLHSTLITSFHWCVFQAVSLPSVDLKCGTNTQINLEAHSSVAPEPNRNRKPEPSEPFFPKPKVEPEPPEPFSRNRNRKRNRPFLLSCTETQKTPFAEEPPEPKTGTAWTVPSPNRNRTEPNRGLPDIRRMWGNSRQPSEGEIVFQ